ncbi:hypothetical protein CIL05_01275 [Virgibacillus profundi]|uniref:Uncharacterized protein n=1 Tax=Virgibacillus profundi TaxID=2024555 RepID=A0A2A2IIE8_9BACI|nr:hypothetical protein [Virgibacillus profundi]PAV31312.1 hypothetical protein CIL05_01275 [Virgibacillus profundi]PXY55497.1 hypothetical protein CIT14_01280 [Virgibacillus profundi]
MPAPYIFVAAAILAVIPILVIFKVNMDKLKEDPSQRGKIQTRFMIGIALSEAIPILLIVWGFMEMSAVSSMGELYIPGIIIIFLMAFAVFFIFLQKNVGVEPKAKETINSFAMVSIPIVLAFPVIALVSLFMMLP